MVEVMVTKTEALTATAKGLVDSTVKAEAYIHVEILEEAAKGLTLLATTRLNRECSEVRNAVIKSLKVKGYRASFLRGDWESGTDDCCLIKWGPLPDKPWWKIW